MQQSVSGSRLDLLYMFCAGFCFQLKATSAVAPLPERLEMVALDLNRKMEV